MTTYNRSDRRHWRHTLRRVAWRVNLLLAALVLAVLLASTGSASAAPACPSGDATPYGCGYIVRGRPAVWPVVWPGVGRTAVAIDPEAQP